jgi:alkylmercury lyase
MTGDEVRAFIETARRCGAEVDDGAVVGLALSLRPTRHRFRVRGIDLYTWCGFDALFADHAGGAGRGGVDLPGDGCGDPMAVEPDGTAREVEPSTVVVGTVGEEVTSFPVSAGQRPVTP